MTENKKPPFSKVILWTLFGSAVFSAIFGGIISLTSKYTFFGATSFVFIALMVIFVPTYIWLGVIEPLWWDKLSDKSQEKIRNWGVGLFLLSLFVLYPLGMFGGSSWSGEGQVNLFPEGAASKNYRLTAEMEVTTKWWWNKEYKIDSVEWPDSGRSDFSGCTISKSNQLCADEQGRSWRIEVVETPERPSNDD